MPVCLSTPARFTLPGAPGDTSGRCVYLVINPIFQHEHGGKEGRFTWWVDCRAHGSGKKPKGSRWGCCCDLIPVDRRCSAETRPAPHSPSPVSGVFSQHLSGTRKDRACQNQGSVFNIIMTAVKTVNITQTQREKKRTSLGQCGERRPTLPLSIIPGGYRSLLASALGAQTAEPWGPNQKSWAQAQGLGIVWLSAHPHGSGSCVLRDHIPGLYLQCVLSPLRFPTSALWVLPWLTCGPSSSPCRIHKRSGTFKWLAALCSAEWKPLEVSY